MGEVIYAHLHTLISIVGKVSSSHQRSTTSARRTELRCIINGELCDIIIKTPRHRHTESFHFLHYIFRCIKDNTSFELFMGVIHPEPDDKEPNANSTRESAGPATPNRLSNFHYCSPNCQENSRCRVERFSTGLSLSKNGGGCATINHVFTGLWRIFSTN